MPIFAPLLADNLLTGEGKFTDLNQVVALFDSSAEIVHV